MMAEAINNKVENNGRIPSAKILLWLAIASIFIMFGGLTSGYIVRQAEGNWLVFELPKLFYISTAIILVSSITMNWALSSAKKNNSASIRNGLILTFLLGAAFVITQYQGWAWLYQNKIYLGGSQSNPAGSFLYVITGLHVAHVLAGILYLFVLVIKSLRNKFNASNMLQLQLCATYWHFIGGLWVYLFIFLLYIR